MKVGNYIRMNRKRINLTQDELAKLVSVAPTAVSAWERGKNRPLTDKIVLLAEIFDVPFTDFFSELFLEAEAQSDTINLPIVNKLTLNNDVIEYLNIEGYHPTPKAWLNENDYFYIHAKGDSMIGARIHAGDLLLIQTQSEIENGEIAVLLVGNEILLKKIFRNGDQLVLQSENSNYNPIFISTSEASIIGKLDRIIIKF